MFWDASFDQNNLIDGKQYSEHVVALFDNRGPPPSGNPVTLSPHTKTTTTAGPTKTTTKRTMTPTKQGKFKAYTIN